jgi:hypothetical protein
MAISPLTQATGNLAFLKATDGITQPGASPNPFSTLAPAAQALATTPKPTTEGVSALQQKSKGQYSNKQFVAPFSYDINVEGSWITVDLLGRKIQVETDNQYRAISSLSAIKFDIKTIDQARLGGTRKGPSTSSGGGGGASTGFGLPDFTSGNATFNAASQIFSTGTGSVAGMIGNRFSQVTSLIGGGGSQIFSNLANQGTGALQNLLPTSQLTQSFAKIPGIGLVTNALGNLPGGPNLSNMLSNPIG